MGHYFSGIWNLSEWLVSDQCSANVLVFIYKNIVLKSLSTILINHIGFFINIQI